MSVGKMADDGTVSVFTKEGINVFKEEDVLITCKGGTVSVFTKEGVHVFKEEDMLITCTGKPILIGVRDSHG